MNDLTQYSSHYESTVWDLIMQWVQSSPGQALLIISLALGIISMILKIAGKAVEIFSKIAILSLILFVIWLACGFLEGMGIPIHEYFEAFLSELPAIGTAISQFIRNLFNAA
ncbi:hypothetical protein [Alloscardovia criceti]|uniref:hypothetical protein n=1 Tax=Alloscardovia criceti TaxID=356828 RepID=UPI000379FAB6|nr:hypothetical protein [Alloscardovia criceti]